MKQIQTHECKVADQICFGTHYILPGILSMSLFDMPLSLHCLVAHQKGPSHSPVSHEKSQVKSTFLGKSFEMRIFRKDLSALSSVGKFLQPAVPFTKVQQCLLSLPADIEIPLLHSWHHLTFFFFFFLFPLKLL